MTTLKPALRRTRALATPLLLAAVLSACGGGGSKSSSGTVAAGGTAPTVLDTGSTVKATGGGSFCKQVADGINSGLRGAGQSALGPDALRRQYEESKQKSQAAYNSAPGEIKPDLKILLDAGTNFGDELAKVNFDVSKLPAGATASYSTPQAQAASTHVLDFLKQRCGIDVLGRGTTTTSGP